MVDRQAVLRVTAAMCGVFIVLFGIILFNTHVLSSLSLPLRMITMIVSQWLLFSVPGLMMKRSGKSMFDIGFDKSHVAVQVLLGILAACIMSALLTVVPILLGFRDAVGSTQYSKAWQFAYEFVYSIFGVALAEELIFRGYLFHELLAIRPSRWFAMVCSSLLFGLFHIFSGNILQIVITAFIGFGYCLMREKIKNFTLLSLILAHGIYDALITLWVAFFSR